MGKNRIETNNYIGEWKIVDTMIVMNKILNILEHSVYEDAGMICIDECENVIINNIHNIHPFCSPKQIKKSIFKNKGDVLQ